MSGNAALFTGGLAVMLMMLSSVKTQQVIPSQYATFQYERAPSANGSSPTGHCSNTTSYILPGVNTCKSPTSSVLFDGIIPTIIVSDGNMWASQLLTLYTPVELIGTVHIDFNNTADYTGVNRVELVIVDCPQLGITLTSITLTSPEMLITSSHRTISAITNFMDASCDSLVTVHIPCEDPRCNGTLLGLRFSSPSESNFVYIAEVRFCGPNNCTSPPSTVTNGIKITSDTTMTTPTPPPDTTITTPTPPQDANVTLTSDSTSVSSTILTELTTHPETVCNTLCPCSSTSTILASVLTAISTALLATIIFVLVQITLCKCRPKATPGGAESAPSAGGEGLAEYEQVDVVALSDPTYMEVGAGGKGGGVQNTIELEENKAYGAFLASQN